MIQHNLTNEQLFLTPSQAAKFLNLSLATFKKYIYEGKLKTFKTPGGHHRISREDLISFTKNASGSRSRYRLSIKGAKPVVAQLVNELIKKKAFWRSHEASVAGLAKQIGRNLSLDLNHLERIEMAALLHDIGFMGISEDIFNKREKLNSAEFSIVRMHPFIGAKIVSSIDAIKDLEPAIHQHHERFDGKGYPHNLSAQEICVEARIIAAAEAYDAMTAPDSYQQPQKKKDALNALEKESGRQFDPVIIRQLVKIKG